MNKISVYELITNRIIEELEKGIVPWRKPWRTLGAPKNLVTKKLYRGINTIMLSMINFQSPYFATIRQVNKLGGMVKKGQKGFPVVFWKLVENHKKDNETEDIIENDLDNISSKKNNKSLILRYYTVFNAEQCKGLESKVPVIEEINFNKINECENVVANYLNKPLIVHGGKKACYRPFKDEILIPEPESFKSCEEYYGTLFHEFAHSTGHENRLGREALKNDSSFGNHAYSKEELIAEIGASFLCGKTNIGISSVFDNQVAYIGFWLDKLKCDKRIVIQASAQAQKAVDYILNIKAGELVKDEKIAA